jgi:hypothetical protein
VPLSNCPFVKKCHRFRLLGAGKKIETRKPAAKIIHNFGRADQLDRAQVVRLCRSIARVCGLTVIDPFDDYEGAAATIDIVIKLVS